MNRGGSGDPFAALGLAPGPGLTDDEVRGAWRRVAAATHPDRDDGGDPDRFALAAAAYTTLRTPFGRGEAMADMMAPASRPGRAGGGRGWAGRVLARVRRGRPAVLALRAVAAAGVSGAAVLLAGPRPATLAVITGTVTWLALTIRHDLAPPP